MRDVNHADWRNDVAAAINDLAARSFAVETLVVSPLAQANDRDPRLLPHLTAMLVDGALARPTDNEVVKATRVYMRQMFEAAGSPAHLIRVPEC